MLNFSERSRIGSKKSSSRMKNCVSFPNVISLPRISRPPNQMSSARESARNSSIAGKKYEKFCTVPWWASHSSRLSRSKRRRTLPSCTNDWITRRPWIDSCSVELTGHALAHEPERAARRVAEDLHDDRERRRDRE